MDLFSYSHRDAEVKDINQCINIIVAKKCMLNKEDKAWKKAKATRDRRVRGETHTYV